MSVEGEGKKLEGPGREGRYNWELNEETQPSPKDHGGLKTLYPQEAYR